MLRTNLSTRPFYNERAVHIALSLVGLVVLALTVLNLVEVVRLSQQNTGLATHIRDDRTAAQDLTRRAQQTRQGINQTELKVIVAAAREANALIDGRTFSWTALFNQIESTLPPEVMLMSVRPTIEDTGTKLTMIVLGRRTADVDEFMEKLEATGKFERVMVRQVTPQDDGSTQLTVETAYVPEAPDEQAEPPAPVAPVDKAKASGAAAGGAQ